MNHLLDTVDEPTQFDFMIQDKLVRQPLNKFLAVYQISTEDIINIVYFPGMAMSESKESPEAPGWIGCIDTGISGLIISGCYDGSVKFSNPTDLSDVCNFKAHDDPVRSIVTWSSSSGAVNGDKKSKKPVGRSFLATAGKDQTVKCWDVSNTSNIQQLATLSGHINSVEAISIWRPTHQPTDSVLLSGDWAGTVFGWNVAKIGEESVAGTSEEQDKKKRKKGADSSVGVSHTLKPMFTIKAHAQAVSGMCGSGANSGRNNSLFTCSWDHAVKEWDLERQDCVNTFASSKVATSVDCSTDSGSTMLVASSHPDGRVRCWDARSNKEASAAKIVLGKGSHWISQVRWRPGSGIVFAASDYAGHVALWDIRSNNVPLSLNEVHSGKALCVNWLRDPDAMDTEERGSRFRIVSGGSDCSLKSTAVSN